LSRTDAIDGPNRVSQARLPGIHTGKPMIILGVILLILGAVFDIGILWTIGVILIVVGVILWILGAIGRPVYGRRYYW
jgi:hypothetical protein